MSVLRRDPTTGRWVVMAPDGVRPLDPSAPCPFCAGNESLTPREVVAWGRPPGRPADSAGWQVRVVPNARPILRIEDPLERHANRMFDWASGTGAHEIIIESPEHRTSLADLTPEQMALVLGAWAQRIGDLKGDPRLRSIFVFKNQGLLAGAGMPHHVHSQVIGLPVTPKALKEILEGARRHYQLKERCVLCDIVVDQLEHGERLILATERFVALAPWASRHPYECWVVPRDHASDFETATSADLAELAQVLLRLLARVEEVLPEPAYNLFLYSAPSRDKRNGYWTTLDADFHWQIQILPRPTQVAGFEIGSGFFVNPVLPEDAAKMLAGAPAARLVRV